MPISKTKGAILAFLGVSSCAVLFRSDAGSHDVAYPAEMVDVFTFSREGLPLPSTYNHTDRVPSPAVQHLPSERYAPGQTTLTNSKAQLLADFRQENDWKNGLVLFWMPQTFRESLPRVVHSWLRNYVAVNAVYFSVGGLWAYYIYWVFGHVFFESGKMPSWRDMGEQMRVAATSMPLYATLPALLEAAVERGWTRAYSRVGDVGIGWYCAYFVLYMTSVEFFVYWMHRGLHDVRLGYRLLHHTHHKYNKEHSLSPFAGLAFNALDGILQAVPYCWTLLYVPMHFLTVELLLFMTGVWTTNIHDCIHGRMDPIMGAGYHTIHHTTYKHNYGHYFVYMDRLFGSLVTPEEYVAEQRAKGAGKGQ